MIRVRWFAAIGICSALPEVGTDDEDSKPPPGPRKARGDKDGAALLLADLNDTFFQHVQRNVCLFFGYNQRGA